MFSVLQRGLTHVLNGTLSGRIQQELQQKQKLSREKHWNVLVAKKETTAINVQPGVKLLLYPDTTLSRLIYVEGFELPERQFLNKYLRSGDTFIDVGANIGLFTVIAAKLVGPTGRIFAFEPSANTYERLLANISLNHFTNVSCHRVALSDQTGSIDMTVSLDGFDAWNSFGKPYVGNEFAVESIKCINFDGFAEQHNLVGQITMIKIDVEGWEGHVISGALELLSREDAPTLQVEFTDEASISAGSSCQTLYQQLSDLGYRLFAYDHVCNKLVHDPMRDEYPYVNLIATKNIEQIHARLGVQNHT